ADAGRDADCDQLLRQGVARPVAELADAVLALDAEGHRREARALLAAVVRVRPPEDGARLAESDPHRLVPQLLDAARALAPARERDLLHALRVAGIVTG
ncbi:UL36 very large tegument protein, partial [Streptomyces sp. NPDC048629]